MTIYKAVGWWSAKWVGFRTRAPFWHCMHFFPIDTHTERTMTATQAAFPLFPSLICTESQGKKNKYKVCCSKVCGFSCLEVFFFSASCHFCKSNLAYKKEQHETLKCWALLVDSLFPLRCCIVYIWCQPDFISWSGHVNKMMSCCLTAAMTVTV